MPEYPAGFEPELGGIAGFMGQLVDQGYSQNAALAAYRKAGGTGSNALLRSEYHNARDFAEARPVGWGQPVDQPFGRDAFVEWESGKAGVAFFPVNLHIRGESGAVDLIPHMVPGTINSTPADLFMQAIDTYGAGTLDDPNYPKGEITSVSMRGAPYLGTRAAAA